MEAMNRDHILNILNKQRTFFRSGGTLDLDFRVTQLKRLYDKVVELEDAIKEALYKDLGKSDFESKMTEIGPVLDEIVLHGKKLKKWADRRSVSTPFSLFPAQSFIEKEPLGNVLIISPWNYPFNLAMMPLIGAISAGNTVILKPSEYAPHTSALIKRIIEDLYPPYHIAVVEGASEVSQALLEEKFDLIFFTGSSHIAKIVMEKAAKNLTPVILELGGKSPVIVDETADIKLAAKRVAFGKVLNAGQTCVAPDYVLVHKKVKVDFMREYVEALKSFFKKRNHSQLPRIINEGHFKRLVELIDEEKIMYGGEIDEAKLKIMPTVIEETDVNSPIMSQEIFGPILPVLTYEDLGDCERLINSGDKPLALYLFTKDEEVEKRILKNIHFGGGCINDTVVHLANSKLPFGGVGASGMGAYHGKASFDAFSHSKSILKKSNFFDLNVRYHPYTKMKEKLLNIIYDKKY